MRSSTLRRRLAIASAAALGSLATSACSVLETMVSPPPFDPFKIYLTTPTTRTLYTDYLDHYACANNAPLMCQCYGRLHDTCDCHC